MPCTLSVAPCSKKGSCSHAGRTAGPRGAAGPPPHAPAPPPPARHGGSQNPPVGPAEAPPWLTRLKSVEWKACLAHLKSMDWKACLAHLAATIGREPEDLTSEGPSTSSARNTAWECTLAPVVGQNATQPSLLAPPALTFTLGYSGAAGALPGAPCASCRPECGPAPPALNLAP